MWQVNLNNSPGHPPSPPRPKELNALEEITKPELAQWYHAALFIPVLKNLLQATNKGHFAMWTNLTVELMKHIPPSMAT